MFAKPFQLFCLHLILLLVFSQRLVRAQAKKGKGSACEPSSKRICAQHEGKPCPCNMWCVKTVATDKSVNQRCAPLHSSCRKPNAAPDKYSKGNLVCKKGAKPKNIPAPREDDVPETKIEVKDGKLDITLSDGYADEKTTSKVIELPEFTAATGGSMFGQMNPAMVGYEPE